MALLATLFDEVEGETLPRRIARAALILLVLSLPSHLFAQTAPEVLFNVGHLSGDCSVGPTMSLLTSSRNDAASWTENSISYSDSCSASAGSGSLSMTVGMSASRPSGVGGGAQCGGYAFEIYTKHPADMTISGSGSASSSFTGGIDANVSFGTYPINAGTYGMSQTSGCSEGTQKGEATP